MNRRAHLFLLIAAFGVVLPLTSVHAQTNPGVPINAIRGRLQSEYQSDMTNLQNNRDYRNGLINATSTNSASSTAVWDMVRNHRQEQTVYADAFVLIQKHLVRQANQALANLQSIRDRISTKIQEETAQGVDMTQAQALLTKSDTDLSLAQQTIQTLANYTPEATSTLDATTTLEATSTFEASTTLEASTTIDLSQARELGAATIESLDTTRQDLSRTLQAIAATSNQ